MSTLNPYAIPPLACSIIIMSAGIIVYTKNHRAELNQLFLALCFSTALWLSFYGINFSLVSSSSSLKELLLRLGYCGVGFLSVTFLQYIAAFLELPFRRSLFILNSVYGICLSILILKTNFIVNGLYHYYWGYYPKAGVGHPIFLAICLSEIIYTDFLLIKKFREEPSNTKKSAQLKYMMIGYVVFSIACWDFIANYGIELYPIGYFPATIFILVITYAIIKHNLMDLNIVINRSLVYSLLITTITIIYLLFVLLVERLSQNFFRYNSIIVSILSAIIIAVIFVPLRDHIQKLVDRIFLKKTPFELVNENQLLRQNATDSEKMRTIATLASGVAHEIRNPLTALKTFVEYFPKKKNDPEFIAKFEKIAGSEICRIESILNDLLAFAKPSPLTLTDTNIKNSLEHALNLTTNQLSKNNVEVKTEFSDDIPTIKADSNKLLQVFINLIINANDAMQNSGILTITASCDESISISISDTGCGIEPKDLAKIFDPFFSTKEKGTGLGLAIVKGIIEDHGGKITVKSEKGQGTMFTITLPTATEAQS
jgi:signal transduction histidine kinase